MKDESFCWRCVFYGVPGDSLDGKKDCLYHLISNDEDSDYVDYDDAGFVIEKPPCERD